MRVRARVADWWRRVVRPPSVGWRLPPDQLVSLMLLWVDGSWQIEAGIGIGTDPVWQRHGAPGDLGALLSEGLGVTWTQAHDEVEPLDPQSTLAAMAGHDGSLPSWIDTCLAGGRPFTVTLDTGGGAVAMLHPVDPWPAPTGGVLARGRPDDAAARIDLRARNWTAEVDRWDLAARPWLGDTAAWLNARARGDWRLAAWWVPAVPTAASAALRPRLPLQAATSLALLDRLLADPVAPGTPSPAAYGLEEPPAVGNGNWLLLVEWAPRDGTDDEPAGVLGFVRSTSDAGVAIRCYHWSLRPLPPGPHPRSVCVAGVDTWSLDGRRVVAAMLADAAGAGGIPVDWDLLEV
jgi:hypothetical protein